MSKNIVTLKSQSRANQGHKKWYHSIDWIGFSIMFYSNFVPKMHHFWYILLQSCRDLENLVRGLSRSLEMSPFN